MEEDGYAGESYRLKNLSSSSIGKAEKREEHYDAELEEDGEAAGFLTDTRRSSISSVQSYELYTPDEDKAVLRKLDRRLVLFMALLYCLSFLDRSSRCLILYN